MTTAHRRITSADASGLGALGYFETGSIGYLNLMTQRRIMTQIRIEGHVSAGFDAVRDAFAENFFRRHELGGACCVYHRGEKVVDVWRGIRNRPVSVRKSHDGADGAIDHRRDKSPVLERKRGGNRVFWAQRDAHFVVDPRARRKCDAIMR